MNKTIYYFIAFFCLSAQTISPIFYIITPPTATIYENLGVQPPFNNQILGQVITSFAQTFANKSFTSTEKLTEAVEKWREEISTLQYKKHGQASNGLQASLIQQTPRFVQALIGQPNTGNHE